VPDWPRSSACFPIWLKFRGGQRRSDRSRDIPRTLLPALSCGSLILFLIVLYFWRYVSLASIFRAAAMPLLIYFALGAASCAADDYHVWRARGRGDHCLQARHQHSTFGAGRRAEFSFDKKTRRRVSKIAILAAAAGTALAIVLSRRAAEARDFAVGA